MKKSINFFAFFLFAIFLSVDSFAQPALLANADVCPTDVTIDWECSPCAPPVTMTYTVPPLTQMTVPPPCGGGRVSTFDIDYSGMPTISGTMGTICAGTVVPGTNVWGNSCSGATTAVNVTDHPGMGLFLFDINR